MTHHVFSPGTTGLLPAAFAAAATLALAGTSRAAISYVTAASTYSQNFDSLPNTPQNATLGASPVGWTDDNTAPGAGNFSIPGWYLFHPLPLAEGGFNGNQRMRIGAGTANTGGFMSWGAAGSVERALGDLGSGTLAATNADIYFGLRLTNNTGQALDRFTVSYIGEQWREGGTAQGGPSTPQGMTFMWSTTATAISDPNAAFTNAPNLNFTTPIFGAAAGTALDGNAAPNRMALSATVAGVAWAPGTDLWLRWSDVNHADNDHGLGIDDFTFSAAPIPEPASLGFLSAAAALAFARRRRR